MQIYIIFVISFLFYGCSYTGSKKASVQSSKIYTIIDHKQPEAFTVLVQDIEGSFYSIEKNRFYAKVSFNGGDVLVYLVGMASGSNISNFGAYSFDSRFHPHIVQLKMDVYNPLLKIDNDALFSAKLVSMSEGANTNYLHINKTVEIEQITLRKGNYLEVIKNENSYFKERLLDNFPQFIK